MNVYDVVVRRPGKRTEKYVFRAYNETILAPMVRISTGMSGGLSNGWLQCLFEPRVIEFERKQVHMYPLWDREVGEDIVEQANDQIVSV